MTRVLFFKPRASTALDDAAVTFPPMGPMYLAAWVRRSLGDRVAFSLVDGHVVRDQEVSLDTAVRSFDPDIIGISALNRHADVALAVARKYARAGRRVWLGGPLANGMDPASLGPGGFELFVRGEGELAFEKLLRAVTDGRDVGGIPGVIRMRADGSLEDNGVAEPVPDLDALPVPDYDLLTAAGYDGRYSGPGAFKWLDLGTDPRSAAIFSSRGCPYHCTYCHSQFGKTWRGRSPQHVVDEIEHLHRERGFNHFQFIDDTFNAKPARSEAIFEEIERRGLHLTFDFPNAMRGDLVTDRLLGLMARNGVRLIVYAIESASPRIQRNIRKNLRLDRVRETITKTAAAKIVVMGSFMMGFPGETEEEARATIEFATSSDLHLAYFFFLTPHPGTEIARELNLVETTMPADLASTDYFTLKNYSAMTDDVLRTVNEEAYRRFYLNPGRVMRLVGAMRPAELGRLVGTSLKHRLPVLLRPRRLDRPEVRRPLLLLLLAKLVAKAAREALLGRGRKRAPGRSGT